MYNVCALNDAKEIRFWSLFQKKKDSVSNHQMLIANKLSRLEVKSQAKMLPIYSNKSAWFLSAFFHFWNLPDFCDIMD